MVLEVPAGPEGEAAQHLQATQAPFDSVRGWTFVNGYLRILPDRAAPLTFYFDSLRSSGFGEPPEGLLGQPSEKDEMTDSEIDRMVANLTRSGGDVSALLVEKGQRKAIAVATLVIILFGGPLATSSQRGGRALRNRGRPGVGDPLPAHVPPGGSRRPVRSNFTAAVRLASQPLVPDMRTHPSQAREDLRTTGREWRLLFQRVEGRGIDGPPPASASLHRLRRRTVLRRTIDPSPSGVFSGAEHRPPGLGGALAGGQVSGLLGFAVGWPAEDYRSIQPRMGVQH